MPEKLPIPCFCLEPLSLAFTVELEDVLNCTAGNGHVQIFLAHFVLFVSRLKGCYLVLQGRILLVDMVDSRLLLSLAFDQCMSDTDLVQISHEFLLLLKSLFVSDDEL